MKNIKITMGLLLATLLLITGCAAFGPKKVVKVVLPESALIRPEPVGTSSLEDEMLESSALLYGMNSSGDMRFTCTGMVYERDKKNPKIVRVITNSHCVSEDNTNKQRVVLAPNPWYLLFKEDTTQQYHQAKVVAAGYMTRGDDFAILEAELDAEIPMIPLAEKDGLVGESVCMVGGPYGLGKQLFRGHITMANLKRAIVGRHLNWEGTTLLQISSGPGASGSSIVSVQRRAIVAILVGRIGLRGGIPSIVAMPISRFHAFRKAIKNGTYRWFGTKTTSGKYIDVMTGDEGMLERIITRIELFNYPTTKD